MSQIKKISILNAFLFIINIIIGTGVFLNTVTLYTLLGGFSFLAYIVTGLLMIPIIFVTYMLASKHPGYNMSQLLDLYFGDYNFILVPLYSLSKLATSVIGILFISNLIKKTFLYNVDISLLCILFLIFLFFCLFIFYDISLHYILQKMIIFFKLIPLFLILGYCVYIYFFNYNSINFLDANFLSNSIDYYKLAQGASITIFAFAGFESLFAITDILQHKRSAAILLFFSFIISMILYVLYQFSISYLVFSSDCVITGSENLTHFLEICFHDFCFSSYFIFFIHIAVMISSFGVTQGIMYSVINNIYNSIGMLFYNNILYIKYCVFSFVFVYMYVGYNSVFILQQLSSFATMILYLLFLISFYRYGEYRYIVMLGFLSMLIFFSIHMYNAIHYFGFAGYIMYSILLIILSVLYCLRKVNND